MDDNTPNNQDAGRIPRVLETARFLLSPSFYKALIIALALVFLLWTPFSAPREFPVESTITIPSGMTIGAAADRLKQEQLIRSPFLFKVFVELAGGSRGIQAGLYAFPKKESVIRIARKMVFGIRDLEVARITIPEGFTVSRIAATLSEKLPGFDTAAFLAAARPYEGFLFPDTYFFNPEDTASEIVTTMRDTFADKTRALASVPRPQNASWGDIVTMASLIEREAKTDAERKMISGILWRRISIGMPLQVDATFGYILGKGSSELTAEDLATNSPYNTYTNKGLPPGPIANPGLASIEAALYPQDSPYLYYLHGTDGVIRYAKTHDEHVANKARYIR